MSLRGLPRPGTVLNGCSTQECIILYNKGSSHLPLKFIYLVQSTSRSIVLHSSVFTTQRCWAPADMFREAQVQFVHKESVLLPSCVGAALQ